MAGDFKQEEIANAIFDLYNRLKRVERELRVKAQVEDLEAAEPASEVSGMAYPQSLYYTTLVLSVDAETKAFSGRMLVPTNSSSKWTSHNTITGIITVDVPEGLDMPQEQQIVGSFFTGMYAVGKARFALFGAGGGSTTRCMVESVFNDYLLVKSVTTSEVVTGESYPVAKPTKLQQSRWDDVLVAYSGYGIQYNVLDPQYRSATIVGGADDGTVETQLVIPRYLVGDIIFITAPEGGTGVIVDGELVADLDINVDARKWSREP